MHATKLYSAVVIDIENVYTVESFIFVGLKFRRFQISDKLVGISFRGFSIKPAKCIGNNYLRWHLISLILFTHEINEIECPTKIYDFTVIIANWGR